MKIKIKKEVNTVNFPDEKELKKIAHQSNKDQKKVHKKDSQRKINRITAVSKDYA